MSLNYQMVLILFQIFTIILIILIIKEHETLTTIPAIHVYIRINNKLVFQIKDVYMLELQMPQTVKLSGNTKKLIEKTKNRAKISSFEVVKVLLGQCNVVDNQYQQKFEVLYIFIPNKSYAYLLNVEPSTLV